METSQGSQALAWSGWIREAQWPVTPRGKTLALACLGATVVPPPAHGSSAGFPKWLDFLPPSTTTLSPHHHPQGARRPLAELALIPLDSQSLFFLYTLEPDFPQGSRRGDPPIP